MQSQIPAYNHQDGRWATGSTNMRRYIPFLALALAGMVPVARTHRAALRVSLPAQHGGPSVIADDDDDDPPPPPPPEDDPPPPPPPPEDDGDGD